MCATSDLLSTLNMFALYSTCAVDFVCHYVYELFNYLFTYVVLVKIPNSQNIRKWKLRTCDNNELTHHLRSK